MDIQILYLKILVIKGGGVQLVINFYYNQANKPFVIMIWIQ